MFKELIFKLPDDSGRKLGEPAEDLTQEPLRFAIHPAKDRPMIAMATTNYGDLKIMVCYLFCFTGKFIIVKSFPSACTVAPKTPRTFQPHVMSVDTKEHCCLP